MISFLDSSHQALPSEKADQAKCFSTLPKTEQTPPKRPLGWPFSPDPAVIGRSTALSPPKLWQNEI